MYPAGVIFVTSVAIGAIYYYRYRNQKLLKTDVDTYYLKEKIGEGGFGAVYKCKSLKTKMEYVVKSQEMSDNQKVFKQQQLEVYNNK